MNKPVFNKVSILGLGLIGGSIALDLKRKRLAKVVWGYNRSAAGRNLALKKGACDRVFYRPSDAVRDADLVILAGPVRTIPKMGKEIASSLKAGAIVTDVGSTKQEIVKKLQNCFRGKGEFIAGHPIAGTENSGMKAAVANLFQDRWWILTPHSKKPSTSKALRSVKKLTRGLGAKTVEMSPREHDQILATISHLPHMVAFGLMDAALKINRGKGLKFAAGGFRDFTRIAASSPEMWTDICLDNSVALTQVLHRYQRSLNQIKKLIMKGDAAGLRRYFSKCAKVRRQL